MMMTLMVVNLLKEKNDNQSMGWSEHASLGSALDSACSTSLDEIKENDDNDDNNNNDDNDNDVNVHDHENCALSEATDNSFALLKTYLNEWDENSSQDEDDFLV